MDSIFLDRLNTKSGRASIAKALLLVLILFMGTSCTRKAETGTVRLVMPTAPATAAAKAASKALGKAGASTSVVSAQATSTTWNSTLNPTVGSDINCYAVFIGGGDLATNSCTVGETAANATTIKFGPNVGFVPAGGEVLIETPAGSRVIYVVGLHAGATSACSSYLNTQPDSANLSDPFLIAAQPAEIPSGVSSVTVAPALDTAKKIIDCKFINSGGGTNSTTFGDKRDGIITSATPAGSPAPLQAGSSTLSSVTTRSGTGTLPNTKIFAASRRVSGISVAGTFPGAALTTATSFTSDEFDAGDEIAWYVAGGTSTLGSADDPSLGACGGGLYLGRFGTARIKSADFATQSLVLDRPISGSPATIRSANLQAGPTTSDFCTIVISRVSSFEQIVVDGGNSLTMKVEPFSYSSGTGGLLMVRTDAISIGAGTSLTIDGTAAGFAGGLGSASLYQGDGVNASGKVTFGPNYNGGATGSGSLGGGGGGHAGVGGMGGGGTANSGAGGSALNHCIGGLPCNPLIDQKVFMGGGGGAAGSSGSGGAGGGVVILYAGSITGAGSLHLNASGGMGGTSSAGAGAGAGGAIGFMNRSSLGVSILLSTDGGIGGSGTFGGGGGGGGVANVSRCLTSFSSPLTTSVAGGGAGASAISGVAGISKIVDDPAVCTMP